MKHYHRQHWTKYTKYKTAMGLIPFLPALFAVLWYIFLLDAHASNNKTTAVITKITDGDTVHVRLNGKDTTLRLLWIDTPEKYGGSSLDSDVRRCGYQGHQVRQRLIRMGEQASAYARSRLHVGNTVTVETQGTDYFKRTLAILYTSTGIPYNRVIISDGYACIYRKASYPHSLEGLLSQASYEKTGLWEKESELMKCLCD